MKVFEIGMMKTGTTSLGRAFEILGYKHKGWSLKIYNQFLESDKKDYKILYEVIDNYDTFVDAPWRSCDYKILDNKSVSKGRHLGPLSHFLKEKWGNRHLVNYEFSKISRQTKSKS